MIWVIVVIMHCTSWIWISWLPCPQADLEASRGQEGLRDTVFAEFIGPNLPEIWN